MLSVVIWREKKLALRFLCCKLLTGGNKKFIAKKNPTKSKFYCWFNDWNEQMQNADNDVNSSAVNIVTSTQLIDWLIDKIMSRPYYDLCASIYANSRRNVNLQMTGLIAAILFECTLHIVTRTRPLHLCIKIDISSFHATGFRMHFVIFLIKFIAATYVILTTRYPQFVINLNI